MQTCMIKRGHRANDVAVILKETNYYIQNVRHEMVIVKFQDDETFGYNVRDVSFA